MGQASLANWGTFLSGTGTFLLAAVGLILVIHDIRLRRRQLRETRARANATLNVDLQTHVFQQEPSEGAKAQWILETRVVVTNVSSEVWAIPAVYIHARSAPQPTDGEPTQPFSEVDFDNLAPCGSLSQPLNVASFPQSIFFVSPGESDSVVRWDVLPDSFARDFPVLVVRAEVFSVLDETIGASYSNERYGSPRNRWLEYMNEQEGIRNRKVIFSVARDEASPNLKKGAWALLNHDNDLIDKTTTHEFRGILTSMSKAGRQTLVVLRASTTKTSVTR